ncbi:MAG: FAD-dependent oxidoreductase, partial [Halodesulfurarchaeum sp.]
MTETRVAIVGAGLAGLETARQLAAAGRDVVVFEAAPSVGGRVRTDTTEGYTIDRGFQVLF